MDQYENINLGTCYEEKEEKITFLGLGLDKVDIKGKPEEWRPVLENAAGYLKKEILLLL